LISNHLSGPRTGRSPNDVKWVQPVVDVSKLTYAVASSVVEEFAHGHTASNVLRELVQNEYDAGGSSLTIEFGADGLHVSGVGTPIDRAGWRRLSVMLGTGRVAGSSGPEVARKSNGIGSKNHGLRSLFLFGNQVYVRSAGLQTVLDLYHGALPKPMLDPSPPKRGGQIFVPYREAQNGPLEVYDSQREQRDLHTLRSEFAPTLIKLAQPNASRSLRRVVVQSTRNARTLSWTQNVKVIGRHRLGGPILRRQISLEDNAAESNKIVELEYQKSYKIPDAHRTRDFPLYFRAGGSVQLGVSLRFNRSRPDLAYSGSFFYPLGAAQKTGARSVLTPHLK